MPTAARYAREKAAAAARGTTPYRERIASAARRKPGATRAVLAGHGAKKGGMQTTGGPLGLALAQQQVSRLGRNSTASLVLHFADGSRRTLYGYGRHAKGMRMSEENKSSLRDRLDGLGKDAARYEREGLKGRSTLVGVEVAWERGS